MINVVVEYHIEIQCPISNILNYLRIPNYFQASYQIGCLANDFIHFLLLRRQFFLIYLLFCSFFGTIALVSDGGRAHFIIDFIYYEIYVPCETHHDCNSHEFLKPSVC